METKYLKSSINDSIFLWSPDLAVKKEGAAFIFFECDKNGNLKDETIRPAIYYGNPVTNKDELKSIMDDVSKGKKDAQLEYNEKINLKAIEYIEEEKKGLAICDAKMKQDMAEEAKKLNEAMKNPNKDTNDKIDKLTDSIGSLAEAMKMMIQMQMNNISKPTIEVKNDYPPIRTTCDIQNQVVYTEVIEPKKRGRKPKAI